MKITDLSLLRLNYFFGAAIIISQLFGLNDVTSFFFYCTFFITLFLWILSVTKQMDQIDVLALIIVVLAFVNVGINSGVYGAAVSFEYFKKFIMFSCTVLYFAAVRKMSLNKETREFLEWIHVVIGMMLVLMFAFQYQQMHLFKGRYTQYLTFRFTNPNLTGLFLTCMIMFLFMSATQEQNKKKKRLLMLVAAIEIVFLYFTHARNAQLSFVLFVMALLLQKLLKKWISFPKWVLAIIAISPFVFVLIYLLVVNNSEIIQALSFIVSEGKNLNSREWVWSNALSIVSRVPLIGGYHQISDGSSAAQLHNSHLDILVSYGAIVFSLFCMYLYKLLVDLYKRTHARLGDATLVGFICVILLGIGEAAVFSGGIGVYLFAGVFLVWTKNADNQKIIDRE